MQIRRSQILRGLLATCCALVAFACLSVRSHAQLESDESARLETKILFLKTFAKYSEWKEADFALTNSPIVIGILGKNPFPRTHIQLLEKGGVSTHPLRVKLCKGIDDVQDCHMLFITSTERNTLAATLKRIENKRVLTISDAPGFTEAGGMACIPSVKKIDNGFVPKIELNQKALQSGAWEFKSELIKMIGFCNKKHG
jgi:hypothetical protein